MEQIDAFSAPARDVLDAEASVLAGKPGFDAALMAFCDGLTGYSAQVRQLNIGPADTLRWALAALIIAFDASAPAPASSAQLIGLCSAGGLAGPAAVRNNLAAMRTYRLVTIEPNPRDHRTQCVRPTETLLALMRAGLVVRLSALERVRPLPAPAIVWAARPGILPQFLVRNVRAYAAGFRLSDGHPEASAMMQHLGGYTVLLELIARAEVCVTDGSVRSHVSPSSASTRFAISRTQVRKLLQAAEAAGWLVRDGNGGCVRTTAAVHARLRHWIAQELAWTVRLVGDAHGAYAR